jgi:ribosomal protein S24E
MEFRAVVETYNGIFKRKELRFFIDHPAHSTPQLSEVRDNLAKQFAVDVERVYIIKLVTLTGTNRTKAEAEIYDLSTTAKTVVPLYIQQRNVKAMNAPNDSKTG